MPYQWGPAHLEKCRPPHETKSAAGNMKSIATSARIANYDLGEPVWMSLCACGFPLVGDLSQEGVFPRDTSTSRDPPSRNLAKLPTPI